MTNDLGAAHNIFPRISETSPNYLAGSVDADGTILFGTGFSVDHVATGRYHVTPDNGMQGDYEIFVMQLFFNSDPIGNAVRVVDGSAPEFGPGPAYFGVRTTVGGGYDGDRPFQFIMLRAPNLVPAYGPVGTHPLKVPYYGACVFGRNIAFAQNQPASKEDAAAAKLLFDNTPRSQVSHRMGILTWYSPREGSMRMTCTTPWRDMDAAKVTEDPQANRNSAVLACAIEPALSSSRRESLACASPDFSGLATSSGNTAFNYLTFYTNIRTCSIEYPFKPSTQYFATTVLTSAGPDNWFADYGWMWGTYLQDEGAGGQRVTFSDWDMNPQFGGNIGVLTATFAEAYDEPPVVFLTPRTTLGSDVDGDAAQMRALLLEVTETGFKVGGSDAEAKMSPVDFSYLVVPARDVSPN